MASGLNKRKQAQVLYIVLRQNILEQQQQQQPPKKMSHKKKLSTNPFQLPAKELKGKKVDAYKHLESTHHTQSNDTSDNCCSCILHTVNLRYLLCTSLESLSLMHKNPHLSSEHSEILHNSLLFIAPPNPTHAKKTHIDHSIVILTCLQLLSIEFIYFLLAITINVSQI